MSDERRWEESRTAEGLRWTAAAGLVVGLFVLSGCQHETSAASDSSSSATHRTPDDEQQPISETLVGNDAESSSTVRPFPFVMYDSANEEVLKRYAERLANLVGTPAVQAADRNPVCCMWIELTCWTPNPGTRGYVINNQPGGSTILAADEEQLRLAIERLEASAIRHDDYIELPTGLLTNYRINVEPTMQVSSCPPPVKQQ